MTEDLFGVCPFVTAQRVLQGKWTILILHALSEKTMRFNELQRALPKLTQATLTKQLRTMEEDGLVMRTVYPQIPPKVEYTLTEMGKKAGPLLKEIENWGGQYIASLKGE